MNINHFSLQALEAQNHWRSREINVAGFEDLIRGTLKKHGDATPQNRASIYDSSRQALERMLSQNKSLDLAAQSLQRQWL